MEGGPPIATAPRRLTTPLLLGLCVAPIVFVWFLLRKGYSHQLRVSAFAWLLFSLLPALGGTP